MCLKDAHSSLLGSANNDTYLFLIFKKDYTTYHLSRERNLDTLMVSLEYPELQINTCSGWCAPFSIFIYIWIWEHSEKPLSNRKQFRLSILARQKLQAHIIRSAYQWVWVRMVFWEFVYLVHSRMRRKFHSVVTICSVPSLVLMTSFGTQMLFPGIGYLECVGGWDYLVYCTTQEYLLLLTELKVVVNILFIIGTI